MNKILKKIVINELLRICEERSLLHPKQMGARKNRSAVDAIALLIHEVQGRWKKGEKAAALFMDVKGAFDHVSGKKLAERMTDLAVNCKNDPGHRAKSQKYPIFRKSRKNTPFSYFQPKELLLRSHSKSS